MARRRRVNNPVLQAIMPALAQGAATGFGFGLAAKALNPRRRKKNGRHGREPRGSKRPAQRLGGARIIDGASPKVPGLKQALAAYRRFHGADPTHLSVVRRTVRDGRRGRRAFAAFALGESPEAVYTPWKHQKTRTKAQRGKKVVWVHKFGEGGGKRPLLIHNPLSGETSYLGGSYRITDWMHR